MSKIKKEVGLVILMFLLFIILISTANAAVKCKGLTSDELNKILDEYVTSADLEKAQEKIEQALLQKGFEPALAKQKAMSAIDDVIADDDYAKPLADWVYDAYASGKDNKGLLKRVGFKRVYELILIKKGADATKTDLVVKKILEIYNVPYSVEGFEQYSKDGMFDTLYALTKENPSHARFVRDPNNLGASIILPVDLGSFRKLVPVYDLVYVDSEKLYPESEMVKRNFHITEQIRAPIKNLVDEWITSLKKERYYVGEKAVSKNVNDFIDYFLIEKKGDYDADLLKKLESLNANERAELKLWLISYKPKIFQFLLLNKHFILSEGLTDKKYGVLRHDVPLATTGKFGYPGLLIDLIEDPNRLKTALKDVKLDESGQITADNINRLAKEFETGKSGIKAVASEINGGYKVSFFDTTRRHLEYLKAPAEKSLGLQFQIENNKIIGMQIDSSIEKNLPSGAELDYNTVKSLLDNVFAKIDANLLDISEIGASREFKQLSIIRLDGTLLTGEQFLAEYSKEKLEKAELNVPPAEAPIEDFRKALENFREAATAEIDYSKENDANEKVQEINDYEFRIINGLFEKYVKDSDVALLYYGGSAQGRKTIASDWDVMFVYGRDVVPAEAKNQVKQFIKALQDASIKIDAQGAPFDVSLQSLDAYANYYAGFEDFAAKPAKYTSALNVRFLAGNDALFEKFGKIVPASLIKGRELILLTGVINKFEEPFSSEEQIQSYLASKVQKVQADLKEDPAGIRDLTRIQDIIKLKILQKHPERTDVLAETKPDAVFDLGAEENILTEEESEQLKKALAFYQEIRNRIQIEKNAEYNFLNKQYQEQLSRELGKPVLAEYMENAENVLKIIYLKIKSPDFIFAVAELEEVKVVPSIGDVIKTVVFNPGGLIADLLLPKQLSQRDEKWFVDVAKTSPGFLVTNLKAVRDRNVRSALAKWSDTQIKYAVGRVAKGRERVLLKIIADEKLIIPLLQGGLVLSESSLERIENGERLSREELDLLRETLQGPNTRDNDLSLLGIGYERIGENAAAADAFRTALRLNPDNLGAKNDIGRIDGKIRKETERKYEEIMGNKPEQNVLDAMARLYSTETTRDFVEGPLRIVESKEFQEAIKKEFPDADLESLTMATFLHDIGKGYNEEVRDLFWDPRNPGEETIFSFVEKSEFNDKEKMKMREALNEANIKKILDKYEINPEKKQMFDFYPVHIAFGKKILEASEEIPIEIKTIVYSHHTFPGGLLNRIVYKDEVNLNSLESKILNLLDIYDAARSRRGAEHSETIDELRRLLETLKKDQKLSDKDIEDYENIINIINGLENEFSNTYSTAST